MRARGRWRWPPWPPLVLIYHHHSPVRFSPLRRQSRRDEERLWHDCLAAAEPFPFSSNVALVCFWYA